MECQGEDSQRNPRIVRLCGVITGKANSPDRSSRADEGGHPFPPRERILAKEVPPKLENISRYRGPSSIARL
jgi:hypothetical protein